MLLFENTKPSLIHVLSHALFPFSLSLNRSNKASRLRFVCLSASMGIKALVYKAIIQADFDPSHTLLKPFIVHHLSFSGAAGLTIS